MEERELSISCAQNDPGARKELYDKYSGHLFGVCLRYASNREEALDILHDSFIKIYSNIGRFTWRGPGSLKGWLTRLTINLAIEKIRETSRFRTVEIPPDAPCTYGPLPDERSVGEVPLEVLVKFVEELPPGYRAVFNLYVFEELSHKEIARMLGINEKSSSSQLLRAKAAMAKKINDYKNRLENGNQQR
ncbi:MAG: sigma-70 family RNA polymerase sigma factor [Bacteroidales bacterium]|nr:sigma-70 family RNA polymerase sigma factor [Bacteroidales bacterium]